ncbi:hypothetical protein [Pseudoduganella lutea]|uniref:Uncharacterized protein n=1 Tax=Pseudoduganella lutea TaxID=321985 RepID=A0A4P6KUL9_9BURK|nr:hypothetical protein [Pseudoduganella lutea]QBE62620.1 hypothetical protein EWM63_06250 [Pseudoduganella lutea]
MVVAMMEQAADAARRSWVAGNVWQQSAFAVLGFIVPARCGMLDRFIYSNSRSMVALNGSALKSTVKFLTLQTSLPNRHSTACGIRCLRLSLMHSPNLSFVRTFHFQEAFSMRHDDEGLPVMEYDWRNKNIRQIAENIWHAQAAGWPSVLTYIYRSRSVKASIRAKSLSAVPRIDSRDEYPFASTLENEGSVWVGHALVSQQDAQRDLMNEFYRNNKAYVKGTTLKFRVSVINHPGDLIKA